MRAPRDAEIKFLSKEDNGDRIVDNGWYTPLQVLEHWRGYHSGEYCAKIDVKHQKLIKKHPSLVDRRGLILPHGNMRP